jgi:hypothetical protein
MNRGRKGGQLRLRCGVAMVASTSVWNIALNLPFYRFPREGLSTPFLRLGRLTILGRFSISSRSGLCRALPVFANLLIVKILKNIIACRRTIDIVHIRFRSNGSGNLFNH